MTKCGECDAHYQSHEQYAGKSLHTGYCNKMMQNVNKWDRCLYEPREAQKRGAEAMTPEELAEIRELAEFASHVGEGSEFLDYTFRLLAHIDTQAAQIESLKKEADCSDIVQALEDAGIPMGDGEQDIITAIEILGSRIESLKEKLVEAKAIIKFTLDEGDEDENYGPYHSLPAWRELEECHKETFRKWCRQQLKAEMSGVGWE